MHVVSNLFHATREPGRIRLDEAGGVASVARPAVIEVQVPVTRLVQAGRDVRVSGRLYRHRVAEVANRVVRACCECVPAITTRHLNEVSRIDCHSVRTAQG
eukprot:COSAG02_NODE_3467_length_6694_cov_3.019409_2_plen_101_part_00